MKKSSRFRVACIQLNAGADWRANWRQLEKRLHESVRKGAGWIVLPENFIARASEKETDTLARATVPLILLKLRLFAKKFKISIIAGSVPEILTASFRKSSLCANTCFVFSREGKLILGYRKMHLFDVSLSGAQVRESKKIRPGNKPGFFKLDGIRAGAGICYDLRFPEYFRSLSRRGAEILFLPSNFTAETGKTAWEVLVRARAIENQCYVVAAGQCGRHPGSGIVSYGHSMIVDPRGQVLRQASFARPAVLIAGLDFNDLRQFRSRFPALKHRKITR